MDSALSLNSALTDQLENKKNLNKKKKKQKKNKKKENLTECCICYEKPTFKKPNSEVIFNGLFCPKGHPVCFTCMRGLIEPHSCGHPQCKVQMEYMCPFRCSTEPIEIFQPCRILAIGMGSWKIIEKCQNLFGPDPRSASESESEPESEPES